MQGNELKSRIETLEQCADDAMQACRSGGQAPQELRRCLDEFHKLARSARDRARQGAGEPQLVGAIDKIEETADRALQACRDAGDNIDPDLQQAVKRAHAEASRLKHELHQTA